MFSKMDSKLFFIILAAFFIFVYSAYSQQANEQEFIIAGISVSGNVYADTETIIALSGLKIASKIRPVNDFSIQRAIQNLWKRKQFSSIDIVIDRITEMGVFLEIRVKEFPRLSTIEIFNNKDIDEFEIKKAVGKIKGDIISNNDVQKAKDEINKLYDKEGISFVKIDIELNDSDTSSYVNLIINIEEGITFKVRSLKFIGNSSLESDDLEGSFEETSTKSWWQIWKSAKFDKNKYEEDKKLLQKYMQNEGYLDAQVISDSIYYDEKESEVDITIKIEEGPRVFIRDIKFDGNLVFDDIALLRRLEFKKGERLSIP